MFLFLHSELNNAMEGWKYRSRELLKAFFVTKKNNKKEDLFLKFVWIFFQTFFSGMKCLNPQVKINKMVNEHTVDYTHPSPSELTSRIHPLIFLWAPKEFIFSPEYFWIFSQTCILHHGCRKFQIHGVEITGKCICESKNWICSFLLMSPSKNLS